MNAIVPVSRTPISIRPATMGDLPFIDKLQKLHNKMVGWMPTQQIEGKIKLGHVIIAQDEGGQPVGYCMGNDQYFKRDDVGIILQLNVAPTKQRGLIGATLIKAMFDRAAYGCRLFCCWCAQDIEANYFWESLGFVPLAFRAGSRGKGRVHIFWQRRIREGDSTTPYWFPAQTSAGSIREDRLVLPIPPGRHWKDEMPRVLPTDTTPKLEDQSAKRVQSAKPKMQDKPKPTTMGRLCFAKPAPFAEKPKPQKKPKAKNDPKLVAAARELRDRWLEKVNDNPALISGSGKYEVSRALDVSSVRAEVKLLPQGDVAEISRAA